MWPLKLILSIAFLLVCFISQSQEAKNDSLTPASLPEDSKQQTTSNNDEIAPVLFNGDTIFFVYSSPHEYPASFKASQVSKRLELITKGYDQELDSLSMINEGHLIKIMYDDELAFVVTKLEADNNYIALDVLAETKMNALQDALQKGQGYQLTTKEWLLRLGYFLLSLLVLIVLIKGIQWLFRKLNIHLSKFEKKFLKRKKNILKYFIPKNTANIFVFISNVGRFTIIAFVLLTYLPFMFSFFPWTEQLVNKFYGYLLKPIKFVFFGFIDYVPNLIFIVVILYITRYIIRILRDIVEDIEAEKFIISGFPKDWANTTQKIISLLIWAFALVLLYPHLPGATSPAFKGVSIFIGALISFGSTSAIANIVAGIVITYMRPYQIGDRVKIQDTIGDVVEKTLLVTRIRTPKNEDVTIPNANIITNHLINYSANVKKSGLVLHTSITIGYDVYWEEVEKLLLEAASLSIHIEPEPKPFVLQTSLDDNYVSYELNAYTKEIRKTPLIYSDIHRNILEVFDKAGIEILSPQYVAARDGNLTTVPSKLDKESRSPIEKIIDHLTGKNQKIRTNSAGQEKNEKPSSKD